MDFSSYLWSLYSASPEGQRALALEPREFGVHRNDFDAGLVDGVRDWAIDHSKGWPVRSPADAQRLFENLIDDRHLLEDLVDGRYFDYDAFNLIEPISLGLHEAFPDFFAPYFFKREFDLLSRLFEAFGIPLPRIPAKAAKRDRSLYYFDLNEVLQEFRHAHQLSPRNLVAFLYDFAPRTLNASSDQELPPPSRVWISIAGTLDFEFLDSAEPTTENTWNCNADARRGDLVLMYAVAPRSHIESIWRIVGDGFSDPFFYFHSIGRIGHRLPISPISFRTLASHPVLSKNGTVRGCFTGANGRRFPLNDFKELIKHLCASGFDASAIPMPNDHSFVEGAELQSERDVEERLVEPLLLQLGYGKDDWRRQLPLRMGRGERTYPDYVVLPRGKPGDEAGVFLVEAKFALSTEKEIEKAFIQAKSYALRLQVEAFVLAAREGVWVYHKPKGFTIRAGQHFSWEQLRQPDYFHALDIILSKGMHARS